VLRRCSKLPLDLSYVALKCAVLPGVFFFQGFQLFAKLGFPYEKKDG